jgi:hypothetical protein
MFTEADYEALHALVFRSDYAGYRPTVVEIPNGDGKVDAEKRYAHVATKYVTTDEQRRQLMPYLERAHEVAIAAAQLADVPTAFLPDIRYGALRILDYPPGSISNRHEDFDLFTLMAWRDQPELFQSDEVEAGAAISQIRSLNPQAHLGQIGELIGLGKATPHWVLPGDRQRSIVYFAIPDHDSVLPNGMTVRAWLDERLGRSRISK